MKKHFVRLSKTEILMFIGFIKETDNLISLLNKYSNGELQMYKCYE